MRKIVAPNLFCEDVKFDKRNVDLKFFEITIRNIIDKISDDGYAFSQLSRETYYDFIKIKIYFVPVVLFVLIEKKGKQTTHDLFKSKDENIEWLKGTSF